VNAHAINTSVTYQTLHESLCTDGDNACGGPFEHARTIDDMVSEALKAIATATTIPADAVTVQEATVDQCSEKPFEVCITKRPQIKATARPRSMFYPTLDLTHNDVTVCSGNTPTTQHGRQLKRLDDTGRSKATVPAAGSRTYLSDPESEDEVSKPPAMKQCQ
jgi:hypothetical protein